MTTKCAGLLLVVLTLIGSSGCGPDEPRPDAPSTAVSADATPVRAGAFCAPAGAEAQTATGETVSCTTTASDPRNRWRVAP